MNKVLIFGAGNKSKDIIKCIDKTKNKVLYFVDNDTDKQGKKMFGRTIVSPADLADLEFDYILVASIYWREIREQLISLGINPEKIRYPLAQMGRKRFQTEYDGIYNIYGKIKFFYDRWYYREQFHPDWSGIFVNPYFFSRKKLYENIEKYSHYLTGKCMDFGCGIQPYRRMLSVNEYVGVEIETDNKIKGIVYYDGHTLPFKDEVFDSIISSEVFEHVSNIEEIVVELRRVLKKDGVMLLTVPFAYPKHCWPFDFRRYTLQGLMNLLQGAGFACIEYQMSSNYQECLAQLKNVYWAEEVKTKTVFGVFIRKIMIVINNLGGVLAGRLMPYSDKLYLDNVIVVRKTE